jgi:aspartyl-tRNA(Asn)/glutamyl-tRNA(Gln) amidotransferase subunit A
METWNRASECLQEAGVEVFDITLPLSSYALPTYYIVALAEASSNLARYDGVRYGMRSAASNVTAMYEKTRAMGFGPEVKRRVLTGTFVLSTGYYDAYYKKAQQVRQLISNQFSDALKTVDAMLFPTSPIPAFPIGDESYAEDPVAMYLIDVFTVTVNLVGLPAISVPFGTSTDGLPLGLQLLGRAFDEETILSLAEVLFSAR